MEDEGDCTEADGEESYAASVYSDYVTWEVEEVGVRVASPRKKARSNVLICRTEATPGSTGTTSETLNPLL